MSDDEDDDDEDTELEKVLNPADAVGELDEVIGSVDDGDMADTDDEQSLKVGVLALRASLGRLPRWVRELFDAEEEGEPVTEAGDEGTGDRLGS
jgi:hypothetical protein